MTLSRRGDYVMRSALALAGAFPSGQARKLRELVAETEIPATFASQILADLVRARLASSRAGRDGGYRLVRSPGEISVLEVIEAAEGPLRAERCAIGEGPCRWESVCPLHETWLAATDGLRELLAGTTLAEVAARDAAIEAGTYRLEGDGHRAHQVEIDIEDRVEVEAPLGVTDRALRGLSGELARLVGAAISTQDGTGVPGRARSGRRASPPATEANLTPIGTRRVRSAERLLYRLEWQVFTASENSRVEAEVILRPIDAERCELSVAARWRQEAQREPRRTADLEKHARGTLREFLRRLARTLDTPAPYSGGAG